MVAFSSVINVGRWIGMHRGWQDANTSCAVHYSSTGSVEIQLRARSWSLKIVSLTLWVLAVFIGMCLNQQIAN